MTARESEREPQPVFLDFEASSLASASYPIEVAWSLPDGVIESHLISPAGIERWTDWSTQAERLHGISRAQLLAEGKAPAWICRRLNEQLAGQTVYTDAPDYDRAWLDELFSACWGGVPSFTLASADELLVGMLAHDIPESGGCLAGVCGDQGRRCASGCRSGIERGGMWNILLSCGVSCQNPCDDVIELMDYCYYNNLHEHHIRSSQRRR